MNYENMTTKELLERHRKLDTELMKIKEEKRAIKKVMDGRVAEERMAEMAKTLSDPERARLLKILTPEGIGTKAEVGKPGV